MAAIMQASIAFKGSEIDFAEAALLKAIEGCGASGMPDLARPYRDILEDVRRARKYGSGTEARISVMGGHLECLKHALLGADDQAEGARLAELLRKRTRGPGKYD